jgi:hypothetical protein
MSHQVTVTDWNMLQSLGREVVIGKAFAFLPSKIFQQPGFGWLAQLLGAEAQKSRVVSLLSAGAIDLPGAQIKTNANLPALRLAVVTCDKSIYREGKDSVHLLALNPHAPGGQLVLEVKLNGADFSRHTLQLNQHGAQSFALRDLPAGDYTVRVADTPADDPSCNFTVAVYKLAPLVASLLGRQMEGNKLRLRIRAESFGLPAEGDARLEMLDRGRRIGEVRVTVRSGICEATLPLEGEGPHNVNIQMLADPGKTASIPIVGSRASERSMTVFSPLGTEVVGSLLPTEGSRPIKGIFIEGGATRTTPFKLEKIDTKRARFIATAPATAVKVLALDPAFPKRRTNAPDPSTMAHPYNSDRLYQTAQKFFEQNKFAESKALFSEARAQIQQNPHPYYAYYLACCCARLGERDTAVGWLRKAIEDGWSEFAHMAQDSDLAALHGMSTFEVLKTGGLREASCDQLAAGQAIEIDVPEPMAVLAIGAFVNNQPWEGWSTVITPDEFVPEIYVPQVCEPSKEVNIEIDTGTTQNASVYVIVKDARLLRADTPQSRLAGQLKTLATDAGKALTVGQPQQNLSALAPYPVPSMPTMVGSAYEGGMPTRSNIPSPVRSAARMSPPAVSSPAPLAPPGRPMPSGAMPPPASQYRAPAPMPIPPSSPMEQEALMKYADDTTGAGDDEALMFSLEESPIETRASGSPPVRREGSAPAAERRQEEAVLPPKVTIVEDPEVLFAALVDAKDGKASVSIPLGDSFADYLVEAFVLSGATWAAAEARFRAEKDPFISLEVPPFVHTLDTAIGRVTVGATSAHAQVTVLRDGQEVFKEVLTQNRAEFSFLASPGSYEAIIEDLSNNKTDRAQKIVDVPGKLTRVAKRVFFLSPGEGVSRDMDASVVSLRVLPGLEKPFTALCDATADYSHACCEQTASKMLSACAMFAFSDNDPKRQAKAEAIIIAGVRRERSMWLKGRGFKMYPESSDTPHDYYGPKAARYLFHLDTLKSMTKSPTLLNAINEALIMAQDAANAYRIQWPPSQGKGCEEAYAVLRFGTDATAKERALNFIRTYVQNGANPTANPYASGAVYWRAEASYAAAALLRGGQASDRVLALNLANAVIKSIGPNGGLYSTVDSAAAISLMSELKEAHIVGASGKVEIDGKIVFSNEALELDSFKSITALEGVTAVEVGQTTQEDWETFASSVPLVLSLEKNGRPVRKVMAGDSLELKVVLEQGYKLGDLLWVCLPDALSRVIGGGQVKRFSLDFEGKNELRVPLAATGYTVDASGNEGTQHFALCVRNMFEEERAGNPGLLEITVGAGADTGPAAPNTPPGQSRFGRMMSGLKGLFKK